MVMPFLFTGYLILIIDDSEISADAAPFLFAFALDWAEESPGLLLAEVWFIAPLLRNELLMYGLTLPFMLTTFKPFFTLIPPMTLLSLLLVELEPSPDGLWLVALPLPVFLSLVVKLFTRTCLTCEREPSFYFFS